MIKQLRLQLHGNVQRVSFRWFVLVHARKRNLKGEVKNNEDGTVDIIAEGEEALLKELLEHCRKGPPLARVTKAVVDWQSATGVFDKFSAE
ncbi:MAG TPA: acylphosphatase [Candidatus Nanoarchaeia archaeon]|nr:acylphosphatase [Candidatus Nanoarchaeia archaeon]